MTQPPDNSTPTVRLAHCGPPESLAAGLQHFPGTELPPPALLVSYVYLDPFLKHKHRYCFRDWILDSGAFSAHNSGREIKLQDYINTAQRLRATDPQLTEVFALDVIGDWKASLKNCEEMWRQGIPAIPCFHAGEPWEALLHIAANFPKIAIGGCAYAQGTRKLRFAEQCFARVWPKRIHGFGFGSEKQIMMLPFHSVDATNWEIGPCRFGRWASFGRLSVRGSKIELRSEVEWFLHLERKAQFRWRNEMEQLAALPDSAPTVRLAVQHGNRLLNSGIVRPEPEQSAPAIRLACCMQDKPSGNWGTKAMTQALGPLPTTEGTETNVE